MHCCIAASDHTSYPFSTQNDKDFENLLSVYLDATFHPLLQELDFHQEGFRYDVDDAHRAQPSIANVGLHGIVYNEMKGAMSDPQSVLQQAVEAALFPTTTYRHNAGGAPRDIPVTRD